MASVPGKSSRLYINAGVPVNGTSGTFANIAPKGAILIDSTNAGAYQNTNTLASPTWSAFPAGSSQETALLAAIPTVAVADVAAANAPAVTAADGSAVTAADTVGAVGANPTQAEYATMVTLSNANKAAINVLVTLANSNKAQLNANTTETTELKAKLNALLAALRTATIVTP